MTTLILKRLIFSTIRISYFTLLSLKRLLKAQRLVHKLLNDWRSIDKTDIDPFKPNTCVIQSDFNHYSIGKVSWISRNAYNLLHIEDIELSHLDVTAFIPKIIAKPHEIMFSNFYKRGASTFLNQLHHLFNVDMNNMLFPSKLYVRLFFEEDELSFITYIEKLTDQNLVLLDEWGNIDSFGSKFGAITGLNYDFPTENNTSSIFAMLPQLIPFFLPLFYNLRKFTIDVD